MGLDGKVTLPGIGPQPKKAVAAFGLITMGIVGYAYWRHRQGAAAAVTDTGTAAGATGTPDPNAIDPATGQTYAQEGTQGGAYGYGYDPYAGTSGDTPVPVTTSQQFTDNGQWAQAAEDYLVNTVGSNPATVADALGRYIHGDRLTVAQQAVVSAAIAFENYPPVAGANGRPPAMNVAPSGSHPPGTITADGIKDLYALAKAAGISEAKLVALNPKWKSYVGTSKPIPKGTVLQISGNPPPKPPHPPTPRRTGKPHPSPNKPVPLPT